MDSIIAERELLLRAATDQTALSDLFAAHRSRLKDMIRLRINPQLQSKVDASDIIQEVMIDATKKFNEYVLAPRLPFYLWLRHLAGLKLAEVHRRHLGTQKRDVRQELSLEEIKPQDASAASIAAEIVAEGTAPDDLVMKKELLDRFLQTLEQMDPVDREVLALRHFERLSIAETAEVLGLSKAGAGSRSLRALKRLGQALADCDGLDDY